MIPIFFRSLRFRIILLNFLTLTITMFVFSSLLYAKYNQLLYRKMDFMIQNKAEGIEGVIKESSK